MKQKLFAAALLGAAITPCAAYAETSSLDEIVVTATRFASAPRGSPVQVTVITAGDIARSAAKNLPMLLAQRAGIQVHSSDGTADMSIDMRGFGVSGNQNTLVLLDGQRLNDIELTAIRWSAIPLASIERIEIVNGSGSVLYGDGATGGTINIITKRADKQRRGNAGLGVASFSSKDWQVALSGSGERVSMRLNASGLDSSNYRANNSVAQNNFEGELRTDAGRGEAVLKFGADNQNLRYPGVRTVDPTIGLNQLAFDPRGTSTPLNYAKRNNGHIMLGTVQQLDMGELAGELSYRNKKQQAYLGSYLETSLDQLSFTPRMKLPLQLAGRSSELVFGVDMRDWSYDSRRAASAASIATPTAHIQARRADLGFYAQSAIQFGVDTQVTLGVRSQRADYRASDAVNAAAYASGNQGRTVRAYDFGVRQAINREVSLFGRVGRSFRLATVDEIFDQYGGPLFDSKITMLEPQVSQDGEVGVDYKDAGNSGRLAIYQMSLNNEIHYNALTFANMNLSPTRRYGLELEGAHAIADAVQVAVAYSYAVAKFREGNYGGVNVSGNNVPLVPRHRIALTSSWQVSAQTTLSGGANYVGSQYFDNDQANTFARKIPAYTTVDVKLAHREGSWLMTAAVNNLFNRQYFTYGVASTFTPGRYNAYPMQTRNVSLNASYDF